MANTTIQGKVEKWVRDEWMPVHFGLPFHKARLQLSSGGFFEFDAVSADKAIVASISTSTGVTSGGKYPVGKVHKLRADILFLTLAPAKRRIMILTEADMHAICRKEAQNGRLPKEIEFVLADVPRPLAAEVKAARDQCSVEVRPSKGKVLGG